MSLSFRKTVSAMILLAATSSSFVAPSAHAGLLFFLGSARPADKNYHNESDSRRQIKEAHEEIYASGFWSGAGLVTFIAGLVSGNPWIIVLGEDGNLDQNALTQKLAAQYPELDTLAVNDLSQAIAAKAEQTPADAEGKKTVTLSREELTTVFKSTEVQTTQSVVFDRIATDLQ